MPSKKAREKWNSENYMQVNISVGKALAEDFKAACAMGGVSVAGEIKSFMADRCGRQTSRRKAARCGRPQTRGQRRKEVAAIIRGLEKILDEEETYMERIPDNLKEGSRADAAVHSIEQVSDAIDALLDAY